MSFSEFILPIKILVVVTSLQIAMGFSVKAEEMTGDVRPPLVERFHKGKKPFSQVMKSWSQSNSGPYLRAMKKYPSAEKCGLASAETFLESFRSIEEFEICLFLIAEAISNETALITFLRRAGVEHGKAYDVTTSSRLISGVIHASQLRSMRWSLLPARLLNRSVGLGIEININSKKYESATATVNWN